MKTLLAILLLAASSFAQTSAPAMPTVAQLLGSWRLVSIEMTLKDGTVKPDDRFGPHRSATSCTSLTDTCARRS